MTIHHLPREPRERLHMAQRPLSDGYQGEAPVIGARLVPSDLERLDRARQARGITRAEYIRAALKLALEADESASEHTGPSQAA